MRFIAGPRQSGKTTMTKGFLKRKRMESLYYNWDYRETKQKYIHKDNFYLENLLHIDTSNRPWICLDEIHKYPEWKNILKTFYDRDNDKVGFIVTGSARLDMFKKSGDSLAGRFFLFRLYPFVLNELSKIHLPENDCLDSACSFIEKRTGVLRYEQNTMEKLLHFSGFPDPFLSGKEIFQKKWKNDYLDILINEDIRSLAQVKEVENIARLITLLPHKVGSPLSVNSLLEDMLVSYNAVKNYLSLLDLTYITFMIDVYSKKITRSLKKEKKLYFYDFTHIADQNKRFENYIALELRAMIEIWNDLGNEFDIFYLRTKDGKESDFLITKGHIPWLIIEVKAGRHKIENHHYRRSAELGNIPVVQIVRESKIAEKYDKKGYQISASRFFA